MKSSLTSVDELRAQLFCTKSAEKLPPTQDAVIQHAKRAHYQALIWHHALEAKPSLPTPKEYGWKEDDNGNLVPFLMTKLPIPATCIALISCGCKTLCVSSNCSCRKNNLCCTRACICCSENNVCLNPLNAWAHNDENDSDSDNEL